MLEPLRQLNNSFEDEIPVLEHLRQLRTGFEDGVPDGIIYSNDQDNLYCIRTCWFVGVTADVCNLLSEGELTGSAKVAAEELVARFTSNEWIKRGYNTSEDISEAKRLTDIILGK